ncbi:MBL fold metallo-hydrolase RNA specificity domain-containing protein [Anaerosalibacter sp. Marseille-P3206]|uniref:MBL fold metallo-hydrolase RNA specificity domain-containing protein n=1 Tax=Anaerosalibacter sp. Marseille-P3206 TaxID=1871005 RepID=UPI0009868349|nr:MBL fold metallo-hydrolase [Anaerosalibacter sp. Marseille-P3206]
MQIRFLGASKVVTGSNFLIETDKYKILLDCGMFQGSEELEKLNFEKFSYNPADIDYLILSHAHIDHSGRIPKLVKEGFKGKIICTSATFDLCKIMLIDSANIQQSDVEWENRKRQRAGKEPIEPLYTVDDAELSLKYFETYLYDQKITLNEDIIVRFKDAGHILGSSIIELWVKEKKEFTKIVFSGDLGMPGRPIIKKPEYIDEADYLIIESTYGNRIHEDIKASAKKLVDIINTTALRGGSVIIPSFAVGRTQEIIYELNKYYEYDKSVEEYMRIPVYVDSPMAVRATEAFQANPNCFNEETKKMILNGDNPFEFPNLFYVKSQQESMKLNKYNFPRVVISSSGMCTAGRIRHHLKHNLWKGSNSIVFVGYQAEGTLGRRLLDGEKNVKILGEDIKVEAEIYNLEGFSGHADQNVLMDWLNKFEQKPKKIFVVHGEKDSSEEFAELIETKLSVETIVPNLGDGFKIEEVVKQSHTGVVLEPIKESEDIKRELQEVYNQFESLVYRTDELIDPKFLSEDYDNLKNKLLELQQKLMDVNMLISK